MTLDRAWNHKIGNVHKFIQNVEASGSSCPEASLPHEWVLKGYYKKL